jgi:hypothetical protein
MRHASLICSRHITLGSFLSEFTFEGCGIMMESFEKTLDVCRHLDLRMRILIFRTRHLICKFTRTHPPTFEQAHGCTIDCCDVNIFAFEWIFIFLFLSSFTVSHFIFIVASGLHKISQKTIILPLVLFLTKCFFEEAHSAFTHWVINLADLTSATLPTITSAIVASRTILSKSAFTNKAISSLKV